MLAAIDLQHGAQARHSTSAVAMCRRGVQDAHVKFEPGQGRDCIMSALSFGDRGAPSSTSAIASRRWALPFRGPLSSSSASCARCRTRVAPRRSPARAPGECPVQQRGVGDATRDLGGGTAPQMGRPAASCSTDARRAQANRRHTIGSVLRHDQSGVGGRSEPKPTRTKRPTRSAPTRVGRSNPARTRSALVGISSRVRPTPRPSSPRPERNRCGPGIGESECAARTASKTRGSGRRRVRNMCTILRGEPARAPADARGIPGDQRGTVVDDGSSLLITGERVPLYSSTTIGTSIGRRR